jgi:HAD superfamily hydrolase (TIGR01509 family)
MDGTLTKPMLDFPRIKAEMGIGQRPILEALAEMTTEERTAAEAVLDRHEEEAARLSCLNPGCRELLDRLAALNVRTALVTRNSPASVRTVVGLHALKIDVMISRDDARPKPHPEPLLLACGRLEVAPASAWMVGDGEFDVAAGLAAGVRTVWIRHGRERPFPLATWREVEDLWELADLLERCRR